MDMLIIAELLYGIDLGPTREFEESLDPEKYKDFTYSPDVINIDGISDFLEENHGCIINLYGFLEDKRRYTLMISESIITAYGHEPAPVISLDVELDWEDRLNGAVSFLPAEHWSKPQEWMLTVSAFLGEANV